jgi:hypothetical protein
LWRSPTTSLLLCAMVFFLSVLLGMMVVVMYMLQRRRYRSHRAERELGLDSDVPIMDPVLTVDALRFLAYVVLAATVLGVGVTTAQVFRGAFPMMPWSAQWHIRLGILAAYGLALAKLGCSSWLARLFSVYDREQAWDRRWPAAAASLRDLLLAFGTLPAGAEVPNSARALVTELQTACAGAMNEPWRRRRIWEEDVEPKVDSLIAMLQAEPKSWPRLKGLVRDVAIIVRVKRWLRHLFL